MPVIRSDDEEYAQIEQVADDILLIGDQAVGGDTATPTTGFRRPLTRLQKRNEAANRRSMDGNQVRRIVEDSLQGFREEIGDLITEGLRNVTVANSIPARHENNPETERVQADQAMYRETHNRSVASVSGHNDRQNRGSRYENGDMDRNSERVLNVIRNWKIRFTGDTSEVTVDEFIYRVNTLTNSNLRGDFHLLCEHAHILFEAKALKWFWRFHRSCNNLDWVGLCDALKKQYKEYNTDFDIKDDIRRRKQRLNESFDEYYDAIMVLCDRLREPMTESELCENIQRNLQPEVRHELLHLEINRVSDLRRAVRRHEKFINDLAVVYTNKRAFQKGHVSEIEATEFPDVENKAEEYSSEVCSMTNTCNCWNCDKFGHSFMECMEQRTVFCYGCGAKNVYKPKCPKCSQVQGNFLKDVRRLKNGHPKQP